MRDRLLAFVLVQKKNTKRVGFFLHFIQNVVGAQDRLRTILY